MIYGVQNDFYSIYMLYRFLKVLIDEEKIECGLCCREIDEAKCQGWRCNCKRKQVCLKCMNKIVIEHGRLIVSDTEDKVLGVHFKCPYCRKVLLNRQDRIIKLCFAVRKHKGLDLNLEMISDFAEQNPHLVATTVYHQLEYRV